MAISNGLQVVRIFVMSNVLTERKQIEVIRLLMESGSINSVSRLTGVHRGTIRRLLTRYGEGCRRFLDWEMRDLKLEHIQCDEIFTFNGKKPLYGSDGKELTPDPNDPERGRFVLYVAMDEKTRLIPTFHLNRRDQIATDHFIRDLRGRLRDDNPTPHHSDAHAYQPEQYIPITRISTDGFGCYTVAIDSFFGKKVMYGKIVKKVRKKKIKVMIKGKEKTKTQKEIDLKRKCVIGKFDKELITTSLIERSNLTTRHFVKRLARRTMCFSKKLDNFRAALAIHFAFYNYCWPIKTFRTTPAVAAGITDKRWSPGELYEHIRSNWPELFFLEPASL
jgi:IS1 family transposase